MSPLSRSLSSIRVPPLRYPSLSAPFRLPCYTRFDCTPLHYLQPIWQPDSSSNTTLRNLVRKRQFASADLLRMHMLSASVSIEPSLVYVSAAADIIRSYPYQPPEDAQRVISFADWFSLIPSRHMLPGYKYDWVSLRPVERMIFDRGSPATNHVSLAIIYALTCASKGFASKVSNIITPFILRSSPPDVSVNFLVEFENRAVGYARSHGFMPTPAQGLAMQLCVAMGWFTEGALLALDRKMSCDDATLLALMTGLRRHDKLDLLEKLEAAQGAKESTKSLAAVPLDSHSGRLPALRKQLPLKFPGRARVYLS